MNASSPMAVLRLSRFAWLLLMEVSMKIIAFGWSSTSVVRLVS